MTQSLSIIGLPNHYIYPDGRIFTNDKRVRGRDGSTRLIKGKQIFPHISGKGYYHFGARIGNIITGFGLHRTLALAFIPNHNNFPLVNHIDGNKLNNKLENLEWTTYLKNTRHAIRLGLFKPKRTLNSNVKLNPDKALEIINLVKCANLTYEEIGKLYGVSRTTVNKVVCGEIWVDDPKCSLSELEEYVVSNNIIYTNDLINSLKMAYYGK